MGDFLLHHYQTFGGLAIIAVLFVVIGRRGAMNIALDLLASSKELLVKNTEANHTEYARSIYNQLPQKFKVFVTVKTLDRVIVEVSHKLSK